MDLELYQYQKETAEKKPKRQLGQRTSTRQAEDRPKGASTASIKCFRCGQQGHLASECLAPTPVPQAKTPASTKPKKQLRNTLEREKFTCQAIEVSPPPKGKRELQLKEAHRWQPETAMTTARTTRW